MTALAEQIPMYGKIRAESRPVVKSASFEQIKEILLAFLVHISEVSDIFCISLC